MQQEFGRTLSGLRKERHISQRQASEELGISQALLSHYENGIREPGLDFVVRACDYYQVSADYLLGRSSDREGSLLGPAGRPERGGKGRLAAAQKKRLAGALCLLFDLLERLESAALVQAAAGYLSAALFQLTAALGEACPGQALPGTLTGPAARAGADEVERLQCRCRYQAELERCAGRRGAAAELSPEALLRDYPATAPCLLELMQETGQRAAAHLTEPAPRRRRSS